MSFATAKQNLNAAQREAVEQLYGPVLVLAGPGTGKTQMLTCRIAEVLAQTDANPSNILCLTFTESAAVEMRNRLQRWIGAAAYQVKISTFHGFCQGVMDRFSSVFEAKRGQRQIADDLQKALAYQAVMQSQKWPHFHSVWDEFYAQRDILSAISQLKREHISPTRLRELIPAEQVRLESDPANFYARKFKEFNVGDWKPQKKAEIATKVAKLEEFCALWEAYEVELEQRGLFDFDDQINWVVDELTTNANLRLDLQEQYQWLLVDEYQDTNNAQNAILWQLTEGIEQPNILAVGDDDQSIYRFQGASVANIAEFRAHFPSRKEVTLTDNYRSDQTILDTAYASVAHNLERATDKKLVARNPLFCRTQIPQTANGSLPPLARGARGDSPLVNTSLTKAAFGSRYAEINWLVQKIRGFFEQGIPAHEIAILVRKNREIAELARELPKFGIPVSAEIGQNIFENDAVRSLILMLEIFTDEKADNQFFDLLHAEFLDIPPSKLLELSLERKSKQKSIIEILLKKFPEENPPQSPLSRGKTSEASQGDQKIRGFFEFFITSRQKFWHLRPAVLAEKLLYESGLADWLTRESRGQDWQSVRKFIDWIRLQNEEKIREIFVRLDLHQQLNIPVRPDPLPTDRQAVQIMTAHKSKGQEFMAVLIPGLEDKKWGNPRSHSVVPLPQVVDQADHDPNEEERRLFFVALTRAKAHICASYASTDFTGRDKNPSLFWHELPENLVTDETSDETENELQKLLPVFFQHQEKTLTAGEKSILQERVKHFVWSASSLQNYLDCPRRFLYQNLYHFPRRPLPHLALGVALHQALELFFQNPSIPLSGEAGQNFLLEKYEYALSGQNLPKDDYDKWLAHGREVLTQYYDEKLADFSTQYPHGYELEYDFRQFQPEVDGIRITGKLDKVEYLDEAQKQVKIVDYKSGKPKSIVPGERLWRQLVFYDLLVRQSPRLQWQVAACELDFLTADSKGKLGTRSLEVTESDRAQVIAELKKANEQLQNLEFPVVPNPTGDPEIDYWNTFGK